MLFKLKHQELYKGY